MKGSCSTVLESLELVVLVLGERILVHLSITVFEEPINCNVGNPIIAVMLELMSDSPNETKRKEGRAGVRPHQHQHHCATVATRT